MVLRRAQDRLVEARFCAPQANQQAPRVETCFDGVDVDVGSSFAGAKEGSSSHSQAAFYMPLPFHPPVVTPSIPMHRFTAFRYIT
ncbi:hypothetical protein VNO77_07592 [Canavalia gladiata]|uniref:Uncharacterized protein n=1 Tax=Canavalia gladiata TaxID=3824 RepID=A0AAN9M9A3_CANGL